MPTIYIPKKKDNRTKRGRSKEATKYYATTKWHRARTRQLEKEPCCQWCMHMKDGFITPTAQVHHLVKFMDAKNEQRKNELFLDPDNHYSVCTTCHSWLDNELYDISKLIYRLRLEGMSDEDIHTYIKENYAERLNNLDVY